MRFAKLLIGLLMAGCAASGTIGGAYYDPAYDYSEFFAVTDGRDFQVVMAGAPFPNLPAVQVQRALLPVMQAAKPRPNLTFTYADPPELPRPYYRMVLVFDAANDLTAASVCAGTIRHKPPVVGRSFNVFAIYCRNDLALSQTTAWTNAAGPNDPQVQALFAQLFLVLFDDSPRRRFPLFGPFSRFGRW
ncbi:hypothetical protein RSO01_04100 [Reyranella soli]|uniref:Lipoprotein n=1 Tax=Reyranella soli TaxID=1230389 RepID=A0A512N2N1_9HYPH|nr:hypothetical protein RSO01_04100 [Reyranella soli]